MQENVKKAIEEYQCSGCTHGCDTSCFEPNIQGGAGCGKHSAGTFVSHIGKVFLGMPKGFNRLGESDKMKPHVFNSWEDFVNDWGGFNHFNVPVWKYVNEQGHTLVRGMMPRRNEPFIHIFLENCADKIECFEINQEHLNQMD